MKVLDLQKVQEIDSHIQDLLNELTSLYQQRNELFAGKNDTHGRNVTRSQKTNRSTRVKLEDLDFSTFNLSLKD